MGIVVVEVDPTSPEMDRIARTDRDSVNIGVTEFDAVVDVLELGILKLPKQALYWSKLKKQHSGKIQNQE